MKVAAAVCYEPNAPLQLEEVTLREELQAHEVLVRVVASGVCHTDILARDVSADIPLMPRPSILGHEGSGIVDRIGSSVSAVSPGDHVIMSYHYDGDCSACAKGLNPYCTNYQEYNLVGTSASGLPVHTTRRGPASIFHQQSSFASYTICTDHNLHKVDTTYPLEKLGPLGCGFLTGAGGVINALQPEPGSSIVLFGLGAVGLSALAMARKRGCGRIIGIDLHKNRLKLALEMGATDVIDARSEDAVARVLELLPAGADYVFEATGITTVISNASEVLGVGGYCLLCGGVSDPNAKSEFTPMTFLSNRHIHGTRMGHRDPDKTIKAVLSLVHEGYLPLDRLIRIYELKEINRAIADAESGEVIKPVILMPGPN